MGLSGPWPGADDRRRELVALSQPDGLLGEEGAFSICTFCSPNHSFVSGPKGAERIFRRMMNQANHLGLYSRRSIPPPGWHWGTSPGLTHVALINCAVAMMAVPGNDDVEEVWGRRDGL